jgi:hypothetical protein
MENISWKIATWHGKVGALSPLFREIMENAV